MNTSSQRFLDFHKSPNRHIVNVLALDWRDKRGTVRLTDVNARERVRSRLRDLLAERGMTGRLFGKKVGHGDQWVSNLLNGRFGLSLEELDAVAHAVGTTPSELVRRADDGVDILAPSERRVVRALRMLPLAVRDHLVLLADYLVGVMPEEIELLTIYRSLTAEEQQRLNHAATVLKLSQGVEPKRAQSENPPATAAPKAGGTRRAPRTK